uniref:probable G-protein coupled receptor 139 n=1 Tax=Pristiophorus japonicus TaxID=55135 RepID=UPI00398E3B14
MSNCPGFLSLPANLLSVVILWRGQCGLSSVVSRYMVAMALGDLMVLLFNAIIHCIFKYHFQTSFLNLTHTCRVIAYMYYVSLRLSGWFTVSFTFDRFVAICCQKLKVKYCTKRTAPMVITVVSVLGFLKCIPVYCEYEPYYMVDNVGWGCRTVSGFAWLPGWRVFQWILSLSSSVVSLPLILLFNCLTVRHIMVASRARRALKGHSRGQSNCDPELENRRNSIILLFAISGSYIVLTVPMAIINICVRVTKMDVFKNQPSLYFAIIVTTLFQNLSFCINTYLHVLTQRRFRARMKNIMRYPFTAVIKLFE